MACSVGGRLRDMVVHRGIEHVFDVLVSKLANLWLVLTTLCELDGVFEPD